MASVVPSTLQDSSLLTSWLYSSTGRLLSRICSWYKRKAWSRIQVSSKELEVPTTTLTFSSCNSSSSNASKAEKMNPCQTSKMRQKPKSQTLPLPLPVWKTYSAQCKSQYLRKSNHRLVRIKILETLKRFHRSKKMKSRVKWVPNLSKSLNRSEKASWYARI